MLVESQCSAGSLTQHLAGQPKWNKAVRPKGAGSRERVDWVGAAFLPQQEMKPRNIWLV